MEPTPKNGNIVSRNALIHLKKRPQTQKKLYALKGVFKERRPEKIMRYGIFNPFWKALAHYLTNKCGKCGQERLLSVFDEYSKKSILSV